MQQKAYLLAVSHTAYCMIAFVCALRLMLSRCRCRVLFKGDTRLPHGRSINRGDNPRVVQYISMFPPPADIDARRPRPRGHVHDKVPAIEIGSYLLRYIILLSTLQH